MPLQSPLQTRIRDELRSLFSQDFKAGDRINETELADRLGVSRTPVRQVLRQLQSDGLVAYEQHRGFWLKAVPAVSDGPDDHASAILLDERVMRDMALGQLTSVISERALMKRYAVAHGVLTSTLRRLMRDGLVEPSPGRGWIFTDVGPAALADGYRFRQIVEPAAILADWYEVEPEAMQALDRDHAEAILRVETLDRRRLFDLDAKFHRLIAQGARTAGLVGAIERQNNIRRVNEYLGYTRHERLRQSMEEHRKIIAAVMQGERQLAAALMRLHLQVSMAETFDHMEEDLERARSEGGNLFGEAP